MSKQYPEWYELPSERWRNNDDQWLEQDSQKQKLYDAEASAFVWDAAFQKRFSSIEEIQKYIDKFTRSAWFRKRFGQHSILVKCRKGYGASARRMDSTVRFSEHCWNMISVLHEVAHIVKEPGAGSAHGRYYARTLLEFVNHVCGKEAADTLKKEFKKYRVKYLPKRVVSEEAREKLRQNFAKNVLKQFEITWIDAAHTVIWTEHKAREEFGKDEWEEIKAGYLPHIVAVEIMKLVSTIGD